MTLRSDSTERQTRVTANHGSRLTKHSLPDRPPVLLRRQRLLDFLHQNINRKLVLVAAAAGYGKTSLVVDFARDTDFPVAWCALDETDRDLTVLAADLVAAMRGPFPNFGEALQALLGESGRPAHVEQLASAFARGIESSIDGYFVLCLDDYHVVEDVESVGRFFTKLLEVLPEQAHLLIASRTIPPFPIAPLAARQEIAGLSEEQLRFTPAEVQALLRLRNDVAVPDSEAEQLTADAEGWITGILLTSHLMWQGLVATWLRARQADAPVYDYLADEVLAGQPAPLRQFLLESAVLPEMDAESCDAVLGRRDRADMMRQAEAQRLFISGIGDEHRAFSYHHLFREFLLARFKPAAPARLREIQKRAGQWYESQGWPETAITFYLAASDTRRAVAIAETNAEAMFIGGRHETLRRWGDQLVVVALEAPTLH
ncbi:MAG: hypothetical protein HY023_10890, partial [Chloroflexi bacterium]|nr:hypothetical protein [Chloroflexota bacterium]